MKSKDKFGKSEQEEERMSDDRQALQENGEAPELENMSVFYKLKQPF